MPPPPGVPVLVTMLVFVVIGFGGRGSDLSSTLRLTHQRAAESGANLGLRTQMQEHLPTHQTSPLALTPQWPENHRPWLWFQMTFRRPSVEKPACGPH